MGMAWLRIGALALAAVALHAQCVERGGDHTWTLAGDKVFLNLPSTETSGIWTIAQDRQGFLWLGTDSGLVRWDGYRLLNYTQDPGTPGSLSDNYIRNLLVDDLGRLWVGTNAGGLNRYDPERDAFVSVPIGRGGTRDGNIAALVSDGAGGLWIGTGKGLDHLDARSGRVDTPADDTSIGAISALLVDRRGTLWAGTVNGLWRREAGRSQFEAAPLGGPAHAPPAITALLEDRAGRLWIGSALHGVFVLDPGQARPRALVETGSARPMTDTVTVMRDVGGGEIWIGTDNNGVVRVDTVSGQTWRERHDDASTSSLPSDDVHALFLDRSGLVWVGSSAALSRNDPQQRLIQTFFGGSGSGRLLSHPSAPAVLALPDGRVWVGLGNGGIDIIDPQRGRIAQLHPQPGQPEHALPRAKVNALARADDGSVFVGTAAGLYQVAADGSSARRRASPTDLANQEIRALRVAQGRVWIGTVGGLWETVEERAGPLTLKHRYDRELGDSRVTCIVPGGGTELWIGTMTGLVRLDMASGAIVRLPVSPTEKTNLPGGYVSSVLKDRKGRLWVATFGRGIQVQIGTAADGLPIFERLTQHTGLPQNSVDAMLADDEGNVWVSTDDGLARIEPDSLHVHSYRQGQGVGFAGFWAGAAAQTPEGELVFGGLSGLVVIHPRHAGRTAAATSLAVTEAHIGNQPVAPARALAPGGLEVAAQDRSLEVEFAALDFLDPEHRTYGYRLQGFDDGWLDTPASRRLAAYTNLPPGDYELQLRSADADGQLAPVLALPVHVKAAWHQRGSVRALGVLLVLGAIAGAIHLRTVYLRRHQVELERLITDRTAELRRSQEQLEQMAYFDSLTGLPNRRMFNEHLRRLIAGRQRGQGGFALLLIDLDGFKPINDTYGHAIGDALLVAIANQLRTLVRDTDLAARLGGDEFAVLLAQTTELSAIESTCARIVTKLGEPLIVAGRSLKIGASIGIVGCPPDGASPDELYRAADTALYQAKQAGRSTWRWGSADTYTFTA
jgi:diguanylate cyclase (GGDEF)-like protein